MNRWMAAAGAALMVRLLAACGASNLVPPRPAPDVVEQLGALELVTHERITHRENQLTRRRVVLLHAMTTLFSDINKSIRPGHHGVAVDARRKI